MTETSATRPWVDRLNPSLPFSRVVESEELEQFAKQVAEAQKGLRDILTDGMNGLRQLSELHPDIANENPLINIGKHLMLAFDRMEHQIEHTEKLEAHRKAHDDQIYGRCSSIIYAMPNITAHVPKPPVFHKLQDDITQMRALISNLQLELSDCIDSPALQSAEYSEASRSDACGALMSINDAISYFEKTVLAESLEAGIKSFPTPEAPPSVPSIKARGA